MTGELIGKEKARDAEAAAGCGLRSVFCPRSIAVVGASERPGSIGCALVTNLGVAFNADDVFLVNPKHRSLFNKKVYASVGAVAAEVELAVIATPVASVPGIIENCVEAGVRAAIIISGGFDGVGLGESCKNEILRRAKGRLRIVGPNCLGVINPRAGLNASFAAGGIEAGSVAMLSQSGAVCSAMVDWAREEPMGLSAVVSAGSMWDVGWGDLLEYFGEDVHTKGLLLYMESLGDARKFMSAATEVARRKPIVVLKGGRTVVGASTALSHTGALAARDDVIDAAFERAGVLRVHTLAELFAMGKVLARTPEPAGPRLTIVTNAGGAGVVATDTLIRQGGCLTALSSGTAGALRRVLPAQASVANPVDILGDAEPARFRSALEVLAVESQGDGMVVILTPQAMSDPKGTAGVVAEYARRFTKPLLAVWLGGETVGPGVQILKRAGVAVFGYPEEAVQAFCGLWKRAEHLCELYEVPEILAGDDCGRGAIAAEIAKERLAHAELLDVGCSLNILRLAGIGTVETRLATTAEEAVRCAEAIGFPIALKLVSRRLSHKADVGGVQLHLDGAKAVRTAFEGIRACAERVGGPGAFDSVVVQQMARVREGFEVIVGSSTDALMGPVLLFGAGGHLTEVFKDRSLGLPPLTSKGAERMIMQTRIYEALRGIKGHEPVDMKSLCEVLVRVSRLVTDHPEIKEIDINPLIVSPGGTVALDARIVLHAEGAGSVTPARPAIRPYPTEQVHAWVLKNQAAVTVRPIRPEDGPAMARFQGMLSPESVRRRYLAVSSLDYRTQHENLYRTCFVDYDRQIALVAECHQAGKPIIIGAGRVLMSADREQGEGAIVVADKWQRLGLGEHLMETLVGIARREGVRRLVGDVASDNCAIMRLLRRFEFEAGPASDGVRRVCKRLLNDA